jgi:hypothetical protein
MVLTPTKAVGETSTERGAGTNPEIRPRREHECKRKDPRHLRASDLPLGCLRYANFNPGPCDGGADAVIYGQKMQPILSVNRAVSNA